MSEHTNEELLTTFLETKDADTLSILYTRMRSNMLGLAHRMIANREDAEDIVEDAFCRLYAVKPRQVKSAVGFLNTLVKRLCIKHLRKEGTRFRKAVSLNTLNSPISETLIDKSSSVETEAEAAETWQYAEQVLNCLPANQKKAVQLVHCQDMTAKEAGAIMGVHEDAAEKMARLAITKMRQALDTYSNAS